MNPRPDILRTAARYGAGSAAPADRRRSSRMSRGQRRLALAGIAAVALAVLTWTSQRPVDELGTPAQSRPAPAPSPSTVITPPPSSPDARTYALPLSGLHGLPSNAPSGTRMQLWVTWQPPLTKTPRVQSLLRDVILEGIAPPLTPGTPPTALLRVKETQIPRLIYGERYGELSAVIVSGL
jgi:hypothetical protein